MSEVDNAEVADTVNVEEVATKDDLDNVANVDVASLDDPNMEPPTVLLDLPSEKIAPSETFTDPGVAEGTLVVGVADEGAHERTQVVYDFDGDGNQVGWHKESV